MAIHVALARPPPPDGAVVAVRVSISVLAQKVLQEAASKLAQVWLEARARQHSPTMPTRSSLLARLCLNLHGAKAAPPPTTRQQACQDTTATPLILSSRGHPAVLA